MNQLSDHFTGYYDYVLNRIYDNKFMFLTQAQYDLDREIQILRMDNGRNAYRKTRSTLKL